MKIPRVPALAWRLLLPALALVAGVVLARTVFAPAPPPPRYPTVEVSAEEIRKDKPDTRLSLPERVTTRQAQPEQVAVARKAGLPDVARFCGAAGWAAPGSRLAGPSAADTASSTPVDTAAPPLPPAQPPPAIVVGTAARFQGGTLDLWSLRSNGDELHTTHRVGDRFEVAWSGDSIAVHTPRFSGLKKWGGRALLIGGGLVAGWGAAQATQ